MASPVDLIKFIDGPQVLLCRFTPKGKTQSLDLWIWRESNAFKGVAIIGGKVKRIAGPLSEYQALMTIARYGFTIQTGKASIQQARSMTDFGYMYACEELPPNMAA